MSDQRPVDPALSAHLAELATIAREIGAAEVTIIRDSRYARLALAFGDSSDIEVIRFDTQGVLVVLRFPASDGGAAGVEVK